MWMATIYGWDVKTAFSEDKEKAKRLALKAKKRTCRDDLDKWTWENCEDYYGVSLVEIKEGMVIED